MKFHYMRRATSLLALLSVLGGCGHTQGPVHNAKVGPVGPDCGSSRLIRLKSPPGLAYEINLPGEFRVTGKKLWLKYRKPNGNEAMMCHTWGPHYPQIYILEASDRRKGDEANP
jgi:hypothetical protein